MSEPLDPLDQVAQQLRDALEEGFIITDVVTIIRAQPIEGDRGELRLMSHNDTSPILRTGMLHEAIHDHMNPSGDD